ncbi:MAG: hypothetical protein IPI08_17075 [Betaproteobacteria bacterium]|nr:hypothetical protein [Betaproteobacteria bacterium]
MHGTAVAKPHLDLRRMHVDVDQFGRDAQEQCVGRLAAAVQLVFVGRPHGVRQQAVTHMAAVDEQILQVGARARRLGPADAPVHHQRPAFQVQFAAGGQELGAQHVGPALRRAGGGTPLRHQPPVVPDREAHLGACQGVPAHRFQGMRELGGVGLEELAPRRGAEEELLHLDRGAHRARRRPQFAAARMQPPGVRRVVRARRQRELGNRGDGRQRLAAKTHRDDRFQLGQRGDLARGVARQRQRQVFDRNAGAVVLDADRTHAAGRQPHRHLGGAGVQRVVHQFAHHRGRAFHHLAGGDLAHQFVG